MTLENRTIIEDYLEQYNRKDIGAMLEHFTDDATFESGNKRELQVLASESAEYFSERRQTVSRWVIDGDQVAIEVEFWCRITRDIPNGAKAGQASDYGLQPASPALSRFSGGGGN
ncbi:MAG: nuclear transport factor 2 family protein [Deltaproteobacteria bacterium]|nr:nuclear transport factor 2 family protein [Deltaproteobacteria bacterium]